MTKVCPLPVFSLCCIFFSACWIQKAGIESVRLPADSAVHDAIRYAVIADTYVSLRDKPGKDGISVGHARKKELYPVLGSAFSSDSTRQELWIQLEEGWVMRSAVEVYSSKEKALTAAAALD